MMEHKKAVLFDMDGVIVLTESLKAEAHAATVEKFGGKVSSKLYKSLLGQTHKNIRAAFLMAAGLQVDPDVYSDIYRQIYHTLLDNKMEVRPGAQELVRELKKQGFSLAIVSSSSRLSMNKILTAITLDGKFDVEISSDDVQEKKPSPEPYLLAMKKIGVKPENALIFEDSLSGLESALLTGVKAIAVRHSFNQEEKFVTAYAVWDSFLDTNTIVKQINAVFSTKE